jgi:hypothetical protein
MDCRNCKQRVAEREFDGGMAPDILQDPLFNHEFLLAMVDLEASKFSRGFEMKARLTDLVGYETIYSFVPIGGRHHGDRRILFWTSI